MRVLAGSLQSILSTVQQICRPQSVSQLNGLSHHAPSQWRFFSHLCSFLKPITPSFCSNLLPSFSQSRNASLLYMHKQGPHMKTRTRRKPLDGQPFMKGVVLKTLIKKPKKPNSANRKSVLVRLTNGKELVAYVPGEGHNLQEHNIVLTRVGRLQDVPGVKIRCVRGKYDLPHVIKKK